MKKGSNLLLLMSVQLSVLMPTGLLFTKRGIYYVYW